MKLFAEKLHEMIQKQTSTHVHHVASINTETSELCTRADLDKMAEEIYTAIERTEGMQKEIKDTQRQLASRPAPLALIDQSKFNSSPHEAATN
ncbi:hypothetical protein Bca101_026746 [Brassica carinata]